MKLLLSMLAATSLMVATSTNIMSCGNPTNQDPTPPKDELDQKFLEKILNSNIRSVFSGQLIIAERNTAEKTIIDFDDSGSLRWEKVLNFVIDYYQDPKLNIFQEIINGKKFEIESKWIFDARNVQVIDPDLIKFANNLKVNSNWEDKLESFYFEGHEDEPYIIPLKKEKIFATKILDVFKGISKIEIKYKDDSQVKFSQQLGKTINLDFDNEVISSELYQNFQLRASSQEKSEIKEMKNMNGKGFANYLSLISETHEILNTFNCGFKHHDNGTYTGKKITADYYFKKLDLKEKCKQIEFFIENVTYSWNEENPELIINYPY